MSKGEHSFLIGNGTLQVESPRQRRLGGKFFVVSKPVKGGPAKIWDYEDTPQGREEMMSLIRGETVIGVIFGEAVEFTTESVVTITHGHDHLVDRQKLN